MVRTMTFTSILRSAFESAVLRAERFPFFPPHLLVFQMIKFHFTNTHDLKSIYFHDTSLIILLLHLVFISLIVGKNELVGDCRRLNQVIDQKLVYVVSRISEAS